MQIKQSVAIKQIQLVANYCENFSIGFKIGTKNGKITPHHQAMGKQKHIYKK